MNILDIARLFDFVREAGPNHGQRVNAIQKWSGGADGDSWCCELATMVLDLFFKGRAPVPRGAVVQDVYALAIASGWIVTSPIPGDLYFFVNDEGHAHHIGFVTLAAPVAGISGNTSSDGKSSNGDGCYEHALTVAPSNIKYARVPGVR